MSRTNWKYEAHNVREVLALKGIDLGPLAIRLGADVKTGIEEFERTSDPERRRSIRDQAIDRHYAMAGPLTGYISDEFIGRVAGPRGIFVDEHGSIRSHVAATLLRIANDPAPVGTSQHTPAHAVSFRRQLEFVWLVLQKTTADSTRTIFGNVAARTGGTDLIDVMNLNRALMTTSASATKVIAPGTEAMAAAINAQLISAVSLERKLIGVVPDLLARTGLTLSVADATQMLKRSTLPMNLAMLDGMRLTAVDRIYCGCDVSCFGGTVELASRSAHSERYLSDFKDRPKAFADFHTLGEWYAVDAFGVHSVDSSYAIWNAIDFDVVSDPGESDTDYGKVPLSQTPILSGRYCPAVYDRAIAILHDGVLLLVGRDEVLGLALEQSLSHVDRCGDVLSEAEAKPLPFTPARRTHLQNSRTHGTVAVRTGDQQPTAMISADGTIG